MKQVEVDADLVDRLDPSVAIRANQLKQVFDALRDLMTPPDPPTRPIGFVTDDDKGSKGKARGKV